jgi:hypothetical protein
MLDVTGLDGLAWARAEFGQRSWSSACSAYGACSELAATDLEAWGLAAFLTGQDDTADSARERAHHAFVADGDPEGAARTSFWLGLSLMMRGEPARGAGWFARMRTAAGDGFEDSVWSGYDSLNRGMGALFAGENQAGARALRQAIDVAARYGDDDLRLLAASGHGQALLAMGQVERGMEELDEVMVLATSGSAGPQAVGQVYCAVISVCRASLDLGRGAEWTEVLSRWCESQPDLVPYRGQCLVHRSEVLQVRGRWDDAVSRTRSTL